MSDQPTALVPYEAFRGEIVARGDELGSLLPSTISKESFVNTRHRRGEDEPGPARMRPAPPPQSRDRSPRTTA